MPKWNGTDKEREVLVVALGRNCTCQWGPFGMRLKQCEPHRMYEQDQRALNGLLTAHRRREELIEQEWDPKWKRRGAA